MIISKFTELHNHHCNLILDISITSSGNSMLMCFHSHFPHPPPQSYPKSTLLPYAQKPRALGNVGHLVGTP